LRTKAAIIRIYKLFSSVIGWIS